VRDVGAIAATVLCDTGSHLNKMYELTSDEKLTFMQIARKLSVALETTINYQSPGLFHFYLVKRKEKLPWAFILAMILLHYFPRFQKEPSITGWVETIRGSKPISFDEFIRDNIALLGKAG